MTFDAPIVAALSPLVAATVWFAAAWARRARIRRAAAWSEQTARTARAAGRLGSGTLGLAAALAAVALAGPRWGEEKIVTETRGLNLVIAVDISRSMLAEDASGSRLARALREARRLVQDLDGDRLGLVAFAGTSYILSPLSVDGPALTLYLDALDPEVASEGGTALAPALAQGAELLRASPEIADRVLVVFTDGEGHDSLASAAREARRLNELGIHLILVAEGGRDPARIPVRDERGALVAWQRDADGNVIETAREDAALGVIADAAQGTLVAAELPDQAGAVRDLVASYKRATATESRTQRGRPRAWIPLLLALVVLGAQTATRRTAALVALTLFVALPADAQQAPAPPPSPPPPPARPRSAAEKAWDRGNAAQAALAYLAELAVRQDDDTAWYNAGTAALAAGDADAARASLARAAASLDPDVRFRALYNLGLLALAQARADTANREAHIVDAERAYREALLLKPRHLPAKWNLELVTRMRRSSSSRPNPRPSPTPAGGGAPPDQQRGSGGATPPPPGSASGGLSEAQADQVLRSIGQEELRTRRDRTGRNRRAVAAGVKDW
jgi:Ca-activated chloride channel family protein